MPNSVPDLAGKSDQFLKTASKLWSEFKRLKKAGEPFTRAFDALDKSEQASSGKLGAYTPAIEHLQVYLDNQQDLVNELSKRDENYWIDRSGVNMFLPATIPEANSRLDSWSGSLTTLRLLLNQLLPLVRTAANIASNPTVFGLRAALAENSLVGLDEIALREMIPQIEDTTRKIGLILLKLDNCKTALQRNSNQAELRKL
jgi:hypothetical protein